MKRQPLCIEGKPNIPDTICKLRYDPECSFIIPPVVQQTRGGGCQHTIRIICGGVCRLGPSFARSRFSQSSEHDRALRSFFWRITTLVSSFGSGAHRRLARTGTRSDSRRLTGHCCRLCKRGLVPASKSTACSAFQTYARCVRDPCGLGVCIPACPYRRSRD